MYNKEISAKALNNGYLCFYDKEHPLATEACQYRVFLHRHIASIKVGRWLTTEEQVHHIDGNKLNNSVDNLEVLTKQEHAHKHMGNRPTYICSLCNKEFKATTKDSKYCSNKCKDFNNVKDNSLTKELLDELIPKHSWVVLGSMFGYTDNGIKKRAKALGCTIPIRRKS
jgi:HNH endonuclease